MWHLVNPTERVPTFGFNTHHIIFELIQEEMAYIKDLAIIEDVCLQHISQLSLKNLGGSPQMYVQNLHLVDLPIIPHEQLEMFIWNIFHISGKLHMHHGKLLDQLHKIQREEHPTIGSVAAPVHSVVLDLKGVYLDYTLNYPIAAYWIDNEVASNLQFGAFVNVGPHSLIS